MHMLLPKPLIMLHTLPPLACDNLPIPIPPQPMDPIFSRPAIPIGRLALQQFCCEDSVAGGVLDVDVDVCAGHLDYDIHVYLEVVPNSFLDCEGMLLVAAPPA